MKALALSICLLACLSTSCDKESVTPDNKSGCLTGIPDGGTERVLIRCATKKEYQAGGNVNAGGTASWNLYNDHQWAECSDCK